MSSKSYEKKCERLVQEACKVPYQKALNGVREHQASHPESMPVETILRRRYGAADLRRRFEVTRESKVYSGFTQDGRYHQGVPHLWRVYDTVTREDTWVRAETARQAREIVARAQGVGTA